VLFGRKSGINAFIFLLAQKYFKRLEYEPVGSKINTSLSISFL